MVMTRKLTLILICGIFLATMACQSKERTGAAIGGASGAGLGAVIGGEEHRAEGAVLGGLLGGAVGYFAGTQLTEDDQQNVYDVLENTPTGQTETWTSDTGVTYQVTPTDTWEQEGRTYRSLDIDVQKPEGEDQSLERVAYKTAPDAKWQLTEQTAEDVREERFRDEQYEERRERGYYEEGPETPEPGYEDEPYEPGYEERYDPERYPEDQTTDEGVFE